MHWPPPFPAARQLSSIQMIRTQRIGRQQLDYSINTDYGINKHENGITLWLPWSCSTESRGTLCITSVLCAAILLLFFSFFNRSTFF